MRARLTVVLLLSILGLSACGKALVPQSASPQPTSQPPTPSVVEEARPVSYLEGAVTPEIPLVWQTTGQAEGPIEGRVLFWNPAAAQARMDKTALYSSATPLDFTHAFWNGTTFLIDKQNVINPSPVLESRFVAPPDGAAFFKLFAPAGGGVWVASTDGSGLVLERRGVSTVRTVAGCPNSEPQTLTGVQPALIWQHGDTAWVLVQYFRPDATDEKKQVPEVAVAHIQGDSAVWTIPAQGSGFAMDANPAKATVVGGTVYLGGKGDVASLQLDSNTVKVYALAGDLARLSFSEWDDSTGGPGLGAWRDIVLLSYAQGGSRSVTWALRDGHILGSLVVDKSRRVAQARSARGEYEIPLEYEFESGPLLPQTGDIE